MIHLTTGKMSGNQKAGKPLKIKVFAHSCVGLCLLGIVNHTMFAQTKQSSAPGPNTVASSKTLTRDIVAGSIDANQKIVTAQGIEEKIPVKINGIEQWLSIRGRDKGNPVLLYLHGGPGAPSCPCPGPWKVLGKTTSL